MIQNFIQKQLSLKDGFFEVRSQGNKVTFYKNGKLVKLEDSDILISEFNSYWRLKSLIIFRLKDNKGFAFYSLNKEEFIGLSVRLDDYFRSINGKKENEKVAKIFQSFLSPTVNSISVFVANRYYQSISTE